MTARRVAAAGCTPVLVAVVHARLSEDAVYLSPLGRRCVWHRAPGGAGSNRYFLSYLDDRRSGFTLTRENLRILREVQS
jgi:hypothetical protein